MLKVISLFSVFIAMSACQAPSEEAGKLIGLSPEVREQRFAAITTDKQLAVFPELMRSIRPRPVGLSFVIAQKGRPSGLKVAAAIVSTREIRDKANLLQILADAQELGTYNICDDEKRLRIILPQRGEKGDETWRLQYAETLIDMCLRSKNSGGKPNSH
jgi:hypothetical protein